MPSRKYLAYINSPAWTDVRRRYKASKLPQKCYVCGATKVDLHHKTYERFGHERLTDLMPLCRRHHKAVHRLVKTSKKKSVTIRTAARIIKQKRQA